ncbi:flagellin and related hook-associated protein [Methylophaga aminisulfidivorans MP]|uniref:Flagellin n=1 Tax=Methylophaga aminisulfidivorans MP TaxID=1026882 RepID=F5SZG9_9GAMM|nr:flagellin [Methylophaga aminisulfidivorans]EGL54727.1 flagellin and related hook-associated protein [Methylophaga aminisulfidivorans MP]
MPLIVNTNLASLNAQRNLTKSQGDLNTALQRLSSGLRVNSAKDDAAGLYTAEQMTADIRGANQAARNAADGISFAQVAEGALAEITNNLQRIREIAVQSANGTVTDRNGLQAEVTQLESENARIISSTQFNGTLVLSGVSLTFQVGADAADTVTVAATAATTTTADVSTSTGASTALGTLDTDIDNLSQLRATFGSIQNRFEAVISNLQSLAENTSAARSRIMDADFAEETAKLTRAQILQQAGTSILAQANTLPQNALSLLQG